MRRLALAAAVLVLLTGCGSGRPVAPPTPTPSSTADRNGDAVPVLPELSSIPRPSLSAKPSSEATTADRIFGADASWPQCPKGLGIPQKRSEGAPMPTAAARFVILGLTNGPSFYANPCLADQVAWVASRHLLAAAYAIVSYPSATTLRQRGDQGPFGTGRLNALRNVGYAAARFNVASLRSAGLTSPIVWIDVESVPDFAWSNDLVANAAVVQGSARGYTEAGYAVGYYSTPSLWRRVVGSLRSGAPEWRAAGQTSLAEALSRCGPDWSFAGGAGVLGQWVEDGRDRNVTCPGAVSETDRWFHQY